MASIQIPDELYAKLARYAATEQQSVESLIIAALDELVSDEATQLDTEAILPPPGSVEEQALREQLRQELAKGPPWDLADARGRY